ncbi:MAG: hypothetical protein AAGH15_26200, partial [Myxococcota bacterium]
MLGALLAFLAACGGEEEVQDAGVPPGEDPPLVGREELAGCAVIRRGVLPTLEADVEDVKVGFVGGTAAIAWREGPEIVVQRLLGVEADGEPLRVSIPDYGGHALAPLRGGLLHVTCARCTGGLGLCSHARLLGDDGELRGPVQAPAAGGWGCVLEPLEALSPGASYDDAWLAHIEAPSVEEGPAMMLRRLAL